MWSSSTALTYWLHRGISQMSSSSTARTSSTGSLALGAPPWPPDSHDHGTPKQTLRHTLRFARATEFVLSANKLLLSSIWGDYCTHDDLRAQWKLSFTDLAKPVKQRISEITTLKPNTDRREKPPRCQISSGTELEWSDDWARIQQGCLPRASERNECFWRLFDVLLCIYEWCVKEEERLAVGGGKLHFIQWINLLRSVWLWLEVRKKESLSCY